MIIIALGSNLPFCGADPSTTLALALRAIAVFAPITAVSRLYQSPAFLNPNDPEFVNACASVKTPLSAASLLNQLHDVEAAFGRVRTRLNAPRTLDLDLIDYDGACMSLGDAPIAADCSCGCDDNRERSGAQSIILPHPRIASRAFVLKPLSDIAPDWRHPVSGDTVGSLLAALPPAEADAVRPL